MGIDSDTEAEERELDKTLRRARKFLFVFAAFAVLVGTLLGLATSCASSPTPAQHLDVAIDKAEQIECVERQEAGIGKAEMRRRIDACRDDVKAAHRDGGSL